jgi:hypothetical protein
MVVVCVSLAFALFDWVVFYVLHLNGDFAVALLLVFFEFMFAIPALSTVLIFIFNKLTSRLNDKRVILICIILITAEVCAYGVLWYYQHEQAKVVNQEYEKGNALLRANRLKAQCDTNQPRQDDDDRDISWGVVKSVDETKHAITWTDNSGKDITAPYCDKSPVNLKFTGITVTAHDLKSGYEATLFLNSKKIFAIELWPEPEAIVLDYIYRHNGSCWGLNSSLGGTLHDGKITKVEDIGSSHAGYSKPLYRVTATFQKEPFIVCSDAKFINSDKAVLPLSSLKIGQTIDAGLQGSLATDLFLDD